jgi:hypothetical protein
MQVKYNGIALTMTGSDVDFSASRLMTSDAIVTAAQTATTLKGANGIIMAVLEPGIPFHLPGASHRETADDPQIDLADYSASAAAGNVYIAYAVRVPPA